MAVTVAIKAILRKIADIRNWACVVNEIDRWQAGLYTARTELTIMGVNYGRECKTTKRTIDKVRTN